MVRCAVWCEDQLEMEVLSLGRSVNATEDCVLELAGKWLAYRIALRGTWIWLFLSLMDSGGEPELLLNVGDTAQGWRKTCAVVRLLEREEVRSLARPIELNGGTGFRGWVIG